MSVSIWEHGSAKYHTSTRVEKSNEEAVISDIKKMEMESL